MWLRFLGSNWLLYCTLIQAEIPGSHICTLSCPAHFAALIKTTGLTSHAN